MQAYRLVLLSRQRQVILLPQILLLLAALFQDFQALAQAIARPSPRLVMLAIAFLWQGACLLMLLATQMWPRRFLPGVMQ